MKSKYIDQYGLDSLPNLILFSEHNKGSTHGIFVTTNENIIEDRDELEKRFKIKICTPDEVLAEDIVDDVMIVRKLKK